ncbi:MAG: hypothetical protein LBQ58_06005 [Synergistaceae bacterium]|jgi:hypothetical protein|nr:hypothetical protein [Synergistaceae bacterium]
MDGSITLDWEELKKMVEDKENAVDWEELKKRVESKENAVIMDEADVVDCDLETIDDDDDEISGSCDFIENLSTTEKIAGGVVLGVLGTALLIGIVSFFRIR